MSYVNIHFITKVVFLLHNRVIAHITTAFSLFGAIVMYKCKKEENPWMCHTTLINQKDEPTPRWVGL